MRQANRIIDDAVVYLPVRLPLRLKLRIEERADELRQSTNRTAVELLEAGLEAVS